MQSITKDQLVAHERVLGTRLLVIARLLLPLASPDLANAPDDPISRSTTATSGLRSSNRRHNDLRASTQSYSVQRSTIVGTVTDDFADSAWHGPHKIHANAAVVNTRIRQSLSNDHTIAANTEM